MQAPANALLVNLQKRSVRVVGDDLNFYYASCREVKYLLSGGSAIADGRFRILLKFDMFKMVGVSSNMYHSCLRDEELS